MKPVWKSNPGLKISRATKPQTGSGLSGVVVLRDEVGPGTAFIKFDDKVRARIAKQMPAGIGPAEPAYLHVELELDCYAVYCMYVENDRGVLLWRDDALPEWIGYIKRPQI